ncbi:hypothetical protein GCM10023169_27610 [Georgenia halophila]|uniref:Uncharacterized protein n=1 Tax=Georgenia halophila TaxID=620889 RepID=A0ABP8LDC4_9MICO
MTDRSPPHGGPDSARRLVRTLAEPHHLLVLASDIAPDEVESLVASRSDSAGSVGESDLRLLPGVHLTGPWSVGSDLRSVFDLPGWAAQAYLLRCPVQRGHPLPAELAGVDPVLDAFLDGVPIGVEQESIDHLRAVGRRLGGALRLAGSGAVVVLDPESATDLTVHAPVWLEPDACLQVLRATLPEPRNPLDDLPEGVEELETYGIASAIGEDLVDVTVTGTAHPPLVLRDEPWARRGVVAYEVRWRPAHPETAFAYRPPLAQREARARAGELIERTAAAIYDAVDGAVCDDDGFLVDPADLRR